MRLFRIVGVSALSVAFCLVLAWGAMVIVHAGEQKASGIGEFPGAEGVSATEDTASEVGRASSAANASTGRSAVQSGSNVRDAKSIDFDVFSENVGGVLRQVSRARAIASDPLKDVADLSKATANQLQAGDRFLESQTRRLAEQYAEAKDAEAQAKLKGELAKTIERHFDVRHEARKREIDQLEARVRKLREHLQKREAARQAIVEMRLKQFISAAEGLGWDTDLGGSRSRSSFVLPTSSSSRRSTFGATIERNVVPQNPVNSAR